MLKTFLQHIAVVLCKKRLERTGNIRKMSILKIVKNGHQCKGYSLGKIVTLGQKLKMQKNIQKPFYNTLELFYAKKARKNK